MSSRGTNDEFRNARVPLGTSEADPLTVSAPVPETRASALDTTAVLALTPDTVELRPVHADPALRATRRTGVEGEARDLLFIFDGVIVAGGGFAALGLEPSAIERIEVLKGAAAAEQYGPRGADGVVSITTRRAGPGR